MGLLGSIIGGILGGAVAGPWGALAGAGLGAGIGSGTNSSSSRSELSGDCPLCGHTIGFADSGTGTYQCPNCNEPFLVVVCPNCFSGFLLGRPGSYDCRKCGGKFHVGVCLDCSSVFSDKRKKGKCSCGGDIRYFLPRNEEELTMFMVMGQIALACHAAEVDGHFDQSEREAILDFYRDRGINKTALEHIQEMIDRFSSQKPLMSETCKELKGYLPYGDRLLVIGLLFQVIAADGYIDEREKDFVRKIGVSLDIREEDLDGYFDTYTGAKKGTHLSGYYSILGVPDTCSDEELQGHYRELAKKYHPDKFQHLGPEFAEIAQVKFIEIQKAYEEIAQSRTER